MLSVLSPPDQPAEPGRLPDEPTRYVLGPRQMAAFLFAVTVAIGLVGALAYLAGRVSAHQPAVVHAARKPLVIDDVAQQAPMSVRTSEDMKIVPAVTEGRASEPSRDRQGATVGRPEPATSGPRIILDGAVVAAEPAAQPEPPVSKAPPEPAVAKAPPKPPTPDPPRQPPSSNPSAPLWKDPSLAGIAVFDSGGLNPSLTGMLFFQVGAVDPKTASEMADSLKQTGLSTRIEPSPKSAIVRVLVGPLNSRDDLVAAREAIEARGYPIFLRRF